MVAVARELPNTGYALEVDGPLKGARSAAHLGGGVVRRVTRSPLAPRPGTLRLGVPHRASAPLRCSGKNLPKLST
jgi:hypothetical protein